MDEGFRFLDIILLAMVAGFIALRLRGVLGRRTGHERPPRKAQGRRRYESEDTQDKVGPLEPHASAAGADAPGIEEGTPLEEALTRLMVADRKFTVDSFLEGARSAYRMIVGAFADGDTNALRGLLSDQVYNDFANAIEQREKGKQTATADFEGEIKAEIVRAAVDSDVAKVTVKFISNLVRATRDEEGVVVDGHPTLAREVTDIWAFSHKLKDRNPNWALVSTRGAD